METDEKFNSQLQHILDNSFNKHCFECETPNPQWVSINNGIFICLKCCGLHKELGLNYSLIKSLSMDELSQNDLDYLRTGGNNKLNNFLEGFNINKQTFSLEEKYKTKASVYYRALLKNLVEGGELPDPPSLNEGSQLEVEILPKKEKSEGGGWGFSYFQTAKNLLGTAVEKTSVGLSKVNEKLKESHLTENIVQIGNQVINKSKEIGNDALEKSKVVGADVYNKSKVIGNELYLKTKDLGNEAVIKSKEYGKIISEKSIAFGTQVAEKSKEISHDVISKTKKGYEHISKTLNTNKQEEQHPVYYEEMKENISKEKNEDDFIEDPNILNDSKKENAGNINTQENK